ncbi:MAG TPA: 3-deoxy-7-phosphoheptulonate synthase, partial [Dehalococcoidia bacterium]|nr:3-deoxy-7-phosphoheptulonate synthase [Dehalococcoidia bacterium]
MMVVMKKDHSPQELQAVLDHLEGGGLSGHMIIGVERKVIGVVGQIYPELSDELRALPGVDETVPISRPYKLASRELRPHDTIVKVGDVEVGGGSTVVIAGQCSVDTPDQMLATAQVVKESGGHMLRGGAFKPRSSPHAFRGLVEEGLRILAEAGAAYGLPTVSEVMDPRDVEVVAEHVDLLQIGTRNAQNYFLLDEVGNCNKPVLLKRGMACSVE